MEMLYGIGEPDGTGQCFATLFLLNHVDIDIDACSSHNGLQVPLIYPNLKYYMHTSRRVLIGCAVICFLSIALVFPSRDYGRTKLYLSYH